jgi:hypothetical protein
LIAPQRIYLKTPTFYFARKYGEKVEIAETKYRHDTRKLFQMAKKVTGKKPMTMITDGLRSYHDAYKKEFRTLRKPRTEHTRHIKLKGDMNNNKMGRLNGEIRDREKTMRGLKRKDTPILKGCQIYHNYIREHEGLNGKTPAEACGIKIEGENAWKTLIQNAKRENKIISLLMNRKYSVKSVFPINAHCLL